MTRLLVIVALAGAVASGLSARSQPPLLIDSSTGAAPPPLDAQG